MSTDEGKNWQRAEDIPQGETAMFIEHPFDNRLVSIIYSVLFVTPQWYPWILAPLVMAFSIETVSVSATVPTKKPALSCFTVTASLGHHQSFPQARSALCPVVDWSPWQEIRLYSDPCVYASESDTNSSFLRRHSCSLAERRTTGQRTVAKHGVHSRCPYRRLMSPAHCRSIRIQQNMVI